ncbi:MAG: ChaN family lipoprotein [Planctomycetes bacterium]|nr:ChaN family lipoprotein [Planctomycetota bacterium]MCP4838861.1 ChaN family lipoprotein [Planctomycetota bacterium]
MRIRLLFGLLLSVSAVSMVSCAAPKQAPVSRSLVDVRSDLIIIDGRSGEHLEWEVLVDRLIGSDVVVLGEQHNDATGHAVQLAVIEDLLDTVDGKGGVALEMLERDEQVLVEDYRDGVIDAEVFAKESGSTSWSGPGSWEAWYQPTIDAAIERNGIVIAANAPRRYVRAARLGGWEAIDELGQERARFVDHPDTPITGDYRDRFIELMGGHGEDGDTEETIAEALVIAESFFLSQQVWDATMAASVSTGLKKAGPPMMLLVGRFHSDWNGGTVQQIRRLHPSAIVMTISLEPDLEEVEPNQDDPQADFVVCTTPSP